METVKKLSDAINRLVRPATFPIGISIHEDDNLPEKAKMPLKHFQTRMTLCQGFSIARRFGFTVGFRPEDHDCPIALQSFGLKKESILLKEGAMAYPLYASTPEVGVMLNQMQKMPLNEKRSFLIAPLDSVTTVPDVILVYGNSAQMNRLVLAVAYMTGKPVHSESLGRGSCIRSLITVSEKNDYQVIIPGVGERALALLADDEIVFSIPKDRFNEIATGLEGSQKAGGFRFPTLFPALLRKAPFHPSYGPVFEEMGIK
jgi:uncharacterized protein (DUF169 family)